MTYKGILKVKNKCAICKKAIPAGSEVYFDPTKSQGKHLAHTGCWEELLKTRGPKPVDKKNKPKRVSAERLDPMF